MKISKNKILQIIQEEVALHEKKKGLWANIHAKRNRGEKPAKPGEKGYPKTLDIDELDELDEIDCWDGYSPGAQSGVKTKKGKGGKRVNNCEKIKEIDETLEEAINYHVEAGVGINQNIFRPGSINFFKLFKETRVLYRLGLYEAKNEDELELLESDIGEFVSLNGEIIPLDFPMLEAQEYLLEAEYQGRKVELNKPKRGEGGKAYVYVNSGKKDKDGKIKVKKVSFGSSMPDAMGDSDAAKKRRKNFGDRHNCSDKDDKTKAGYWSCRATKFFGRDISGWW
jgi:hypothetical protein